MNLLATLLLGVVCAASRAALPAGAATELVKLLDPSPSTGDQVAGPAAAACEEAAGEALRTCVMEVNHARRACYTETSAPCAADAPEIAAALGTLDASARAACSVGDIGTLSVDGWVKRLRVACESETASIASRTFGGPHGAVWAASPAEDRPCLALAHESVSALIAEFLALRNDCLAAGICDASALASTENALAASAVTDVTAACVTLEDLIGMDPQTYVDRAMAQVDCLTATAHPDPSPLTLSCGPTTIASSLERGVWVPIELPQETYGTRCGDGSNYQFWISLAPVGEPLEDVLVYLEGGGVCVPEGDPGASAFDIGCRSKREAEPWLFEAQSEFHTPPSAGVLSDDPFVSPFSSWTRVYVPYCTQDLHIGGGATSDFAPDLVVHRFGAINLRTALRYVRNVLWRELDQQGGDGYRPDRITSLFGGFSAGGYGTLYNYHWVLDDLQWRHTAAYPDSALALDNGDPLWNLETFASLVISGNPPLNWAALHYLAPYCFSPSCVYGPVLLAATAPRLTGEPEQQIMVISNQNDELGQMATTMFDRGTTYEQGRVNWINAMRHSYCDTRQLPGVNYYLMPFSEDLHSTTLTDYYFADALVRDQSMRDWLEEAVANPEGVVDRVEEGSLTQSYPGVDPFPCTLFEATPTATPTPTPTPTPTATPKPLPPLVGDLPMCKSKRGRQVTVLVPQSGVQRSLDKGFFTRGECPDATNGRVLCKTKRGRRVNVLLPGSRVQRALEKGFCTLGECGTE